MKRLHTHINICLFHISSIYKSDSQIVNYSIPSTWTLEDGYANPKDSDVYPFNTIGGLFGTMFSFVFNIHKNNLISDCNMQGFKVNVEWYRVNMRPS